MLNINLNKYESAFLAAIKNNMEEEVLKFIETPNLIKRDSLETPYIIEVAKNKNKNLFVQLLLHPLYSPQNIKDYNQIQCQDGCTLLGHCALIGFTFGLRILLNDFEPLLRKKQISEKCIPRLKRGIDINYILEDGSTVFHIAVLGNNPKVLKILLQNGGDFNIAQDQGSPLQVAVRDFKFKSAFFLAKQKNCDYTTIEQDFGNTVIHDCIFLDLEKVFLVIMKNLEELYETEPEKVIEIMNIKNYVENNLILEAAKQTNTFFLNYLLERAEKYKIDINAKNRLGEDYKSMRKVYKPKSYRLGSDDEKDYEQMENDGENSSSLEEENQNQKKNQKYQQNRENFVQDDDFEELLNQEENKEKKKLLKTNEFAEKTLQELEKTSQERKNIEKKENFNNILYIAFFLGLAIIIYALFQGSVIIQEQILLNQENQENLNINISNNDNNIDTDSKMDL